MINQGVLRLKEVDGDLHYTMFSNGEFVNLSETLNALLWDKIVRVTISDNKGKPIFNEDGKLVKAKFKEHKFSKSNLYTYRVGKSDLDEVLWNHVDEKVKISVKVLSLD